MRLSQKLSRHSCDPPNSDMKVSSEFGNTSSCCCSDLDLSGMSLRAKPRPKISFLPCHFERGRHPRGIGWNRPGYSLLVSRGNHPTTHLMLWHNFRLGQPM